VRLATIAAASELGRTCRVAQLSQRARIQVKKKRKLAVSCSTDLQRGRPNHKKDWSANQADSRQRSCQFEPVESRSRFVNLFCLNNVCSGFLQVSSAPSERGTTVTCWCGFVFDIFFLPIFSAPRWPLFSIRNLWKPMSLSMLLR
jgi:hypothetical protein